MLLNFNKLPGVGESIFGAPGADCTMTLAAPAPPLSRTLLEPHDRNLVIDPVRHRAAIKRGGGFEITTLERVIPEPSTHADELQALGICRRQKALGLMRPKAS